LEIKNCSHFQGDDSPLSEHSHLITDSWDIAEYLENEYKDRRSLFGGNKLYHFFFQKYVNTYVTSPLRHLVVPKVPKILDDKSAEYYHRARAEGYGVSLEVMAARDPAPYIAELKQSLQPFLLTLQHAKKENIVNYNYSDIIMVSIFLWIEEVDVTLLHKIFEWDVDGVLQNWYSRCKAEFDIENLKTK